MLQTHATLPTAQLMTWHFLRHLENMLKVPTIYTHIPFGKGPAALQSCTILKSSTIPTEDAIEKGASELADAVNAKAEAAGASHVSFEELDHLPNADSCHSAKDAATGVNVRFASATEALTAERLFRIDICFRLWKLLPGEGA